MCHNLSTGKIYSPAAQLSRQASPLPVCWYKLSLCGGYISLYKDLSVTLTHLIVCQLFSESLIRKLEYLLNQIWTLWNAVLILFPTPNNEQTMAWLDATLATVDITLSND